MLGLIIPGLRMGAGGSARFVAGGRGLVVRVSAVITITRAPPAAAAPVRPPRTDPAVRV